MPRLFLPGYGAPGSVYEQALAASWSVVELPSFHATGGRLERYRSFVDNLLADRAPVTLGGHSMGASLAVSAAASHPERVERLVLVAPAGLPLSKPVSASARDFYSQIVRGEYALRDVRRGIGAFAAAPLAAARLARDVRRLHLAAELEAVRRAGIPCSVIGCSSDTLTPSSHCLRVARMLGASYRELDLAGGHMWMLAAPHELAAALAPG